MNRFKRWYYCACTLLREDVGTEVCGEEGPPAIARNTTLHTFICNHLMWDIYTADTMLLSYGRYCRFMKLILDYFFVIFMDDVIITDASEVFLEAQLDMPSCIGGAGLPLGGAAAGPPRKTPSPSASAITSSIPMVATAIATGIAFAC